MKAYKVTLEQGNGWCILKHIDDVAATIGDSGDVDDIYIVEVIEMPESEIDALPDFDGF